MGQTDVTYEPKILVLADDSPHHRYSVEQAERRNRKRLQALGYRVVVVKAEEPAVGLNELASRLEG